MHAGRRCTGAVPLGAALAANLQQLQQGAHQRADCTITASRCCWRLLQACCCTAFSPLSSLIVYTLLLYTLTFCVVQHHVATVASHLQHVAVHIEQAYLLVGFGWPQLHRLWPCWSGLLLYLNAASRNTSSLSAQPHQGCYMSGSLQLCSDFVWYGLDLITSSDSLLESLGPLLFILCT